MEYTYSEIINKFPPKNSKKAILQNVDAEDVELDSRLLLGGNSILMVFDGFQIVIKQTVNKKYLITQLG